MIEITKTNLDGVLLINPPTIFEDFRGSYIETYNKKLYKEAGIKDHFVQDDISISRKNVLRGLHGDEKTWKLISCLYGKLFISVVNCDMKSEHFGTWQTFTLSDSNRTQILVPPKHANGHLVISRQAIFHYKQSTYYDGVENQFTYRWDEPKFGIHWPIKDPILSMRDDKAPYL